MSEKPSCFVCGRNDYDKPAITHATLPEIVVCLTCRDAAQAARALLTRAQIQAMSVASDVAALPPEGERHE